MSVRVVVSDSLKLKQIKGKLENTYPLMSQWRGIRFRLVREIFENEVDPDGKPSRELTEKYLKWKSKNYPGKKKRELTGETRRSHRVKISKDSLQESFEGVADTLQEYQGLPLVPEEWDDRTYNEFEKAAIRYLNI